MKKLFSIITIVLLFIISGIIFWAALSPVTFYKFWKRYPAVTEPISKVSVLGHRVLDTRGLGGSFATSSEIITGPSGRILLSKETWLVEIVSDDAQKENGLSNRKALLKNRGMLFVFDKLANQSFWMKNMIIPLDIIFFDEQWQIVLIEKDISPQTFPKTFGNSVKSKYVLEINAGEADIFGLKVGDQAIFLNL